MNINVGCGEFPAQGWLNLDLTHAAADQRWDALEGLPEVDGPIQRIYAGHVLEHILIDEVAPMLARWREHPGVTEDTLLAVVGPDCDRVDQLLAQDRLTQQEADTIISGAGRWAGDEHLWRSTPGETAHLLHKAGWASQPVPLDVLSRTGWPVTSLIDWQFSLVATIDQNASSTS